MELRHKEPPRVRVEGSFGGLKVGTPFRFRYNYIPLIKIDHGYVNPETGEMHLHHNPGSPCVLLNAVFEWEDQIV